MPNRKIWPECRRSRLLHAFLLSSFLAGCAIQSPQIAQKEAPQSIATQQKAQQAAVKQEPSAPTLKKEDRARPDHQRNCLWSLVIA